MPVTITSMPVCGLHGEAAHLVFQITPEMRGALVLDVEIDVAAGVEGDLGELAAQPHEAVGVLDRPLQRERQLGDGVRLAGWKADSGAARSVIGAI